MNKHLRIDIAHTICNKSAANLAHALSRAGFVDVRVYNAYYDVRRVGSFLINYGSGCANLRKLEIDINNFQAVHRCIDKIETLKLLPKGYGVEFVTKKSKIPDHWTWICVREKVDGKNKDGLSYYPQECKGGVPDAPLYTEYFNHRQEYRVVILKGKLVGIYYKDIGDDGTCFNIQNPKNGYEGIIKACIKASKSLGIDFVGFDVVASNKKNFRILEANSGPVFTEEIGQAFVKLLSKSR